MALGRRVTDALKMTVPVIGRVDVRLKLKNIFLLLQKLTAYTLLPGVCVC